MCSDYKFKVKSADKFSLKEIFSNLGAFAAAFSPSFAKNKLIFIHFNESSEYSESGGFGESSDSGDSE